MKPLNICAAILLLAPAAASAATITQVPWGTLADGQKINRYTMTNSHGASVSMMELGAAILSVDAPDRNGKLADVVLGYDKAADYNTNNSPYFGMTLGRYANRIFGPQFTLDGKTYPLARPAPRPANAGGPAGAAAVAGSAAAPQPSPAPAPSGQGSVSMLHGGPEGFSSKVWTPSRVKTPLGNGLRFTLVSPDGDQGFPGKMTASITYVWTDDNKLIADYSATTTKPTVVNLSQHSYFNMKGAGNGDVMDQVLKIDADFYTFALPNNLPTGEILKVAGTPFDFTTPTPIGRNIGADDAQMKANRGYNQNYVLRRSTMPGEMAEAATLYDPASGRKLTLSTNQPALFLYTANAISTTRVMKGGVTYPVRAGVAMEIGGYPDAPNQPHFPLTTLLPGQTFHGRTEWAFTAE